MFEYLTGLTPHKLSDVDYDQVISRLLQKENHVFAFSERAKALKASGDFLRAASLWEKASAIMPDEHYFIQQQALCLYKSEWPSKETSLLSALTVISRIYQEDDTNDPETLGLVGAIYKRLFEINGDRQTLGLAINAYKRGYLLSRNYYTGENYASCLDVLAKTTDDEEEVAFSKFEAKRTRREIVASLSRQIQESDGQDLKWAYATLANCSFHLGNAEVGLQYEEMFLAQNPDQWEVDTYFAHKPKISAQLEA